MSITTLACPRCGAPFHQRVDMVPFGYVDRVTCDECGLTTLRDELRVERNLSVLLGGAPRGTAGILGLIDTLTVDVTESSSPAGDAETTTFSTLALPDLTVTPVLLNHVTFNARVAWINAQQGPDDAVWYLEWREGSGSFTTVGPLSVTGDLNYHTLTSGEISLDASGNPWTTAVINSLEMRVRAVTDANGTQLPTDLLVGNYYAEIDGST